MRDISAWQEGDVSLLSTRRKKRYKQHKAALEAYFTTDEPLPDIVHKYYLQSEETVLEMAKKCLMQHKDGMLWGFRALLPGVTVIDHAAHDEEIDTAKREAIKVTQLPQTFAMPVPGTPVPDVLIDEGNEEGEQPTGSEASIPMEVQPAQQQDEPTVEQSETGVQEPVLIEPTVAED